MYKQKLLDAVSFVYSFNESLVEYEEDFLEKEDKVKIKLIRKINPNLIDESSIAYTKHVLEKYKEEIGSSYDISFLSQVNCESHKDEREKIINFKFDKKTNSLSLLSDVVSSSKMSCAGFGKGSILSINDLFVLLDDVLSGTVTIKRKSLKEINKFISKIDYDSLISSGNLPDLYGFSFLREFQKIGVLFNILNKNTILGDEMGLGKTIQAICSSYLVNNQDTLVICSSSLKYVLKNQVEKFFSDIDVIILGKDNVKKSKNRRFFIINYESIHNFEDEIKNANINVVIFDEIHLIKNSKALRTKNTLKIVKNFEYKFGLSGTCILNKPIEMASQIDAIGSLSHFGGYWGFMEKYHPEEGERAVTQKFRTKKVFSEEKSELLGRDIREVFYLRRSKKEVAKEIPDKQRTMIPIEISNRDKYERACFEYEELKDKGVSRDILGKKLSEVNQILSDGKVESALQTIALFKNNKEKLVVFCHHNFIKNKIMEAYPDSLHIFKEDTPEERFLAERKFQESDEPTTIVSTIRTGYAGYTLDSATNVLFVEFDPCPSINEQAEDRVHRMDTKDVVNAWYLYAKNTKEFNKISSLMDKAEMIKLANKNQAEASFDLSLEKDIFEIEDVINPQ